MDQAEPGDPHHDQVDGDDVVEELRHDEDQDSATSETIGWMWATVSIK